MPQNSVITTAKSPIKQQEFDLQCTKHNVTKSCPTNYSYPTTHNPKNPERPSNLSTCPSYFRWIHEDLRHWRDSGITKDMIERARKTAHFRLVIVNGKAYVEKYKQSIQTRDKFYFVGNIAAAEIVPWKIAGFGAHV